MEVASFKLLRSDQQVQGFSTRPPLPSAQEQAAQRGIPLVPDDSNTKAPHQKTWDPGLRVTFQYDAVVQAADRGL
jgi:hypothetical protein